MKPTFEPVENGLEIIDRIERHRCQLTTHEPVAPTAVASDTIPYPVDAAVSVTTDTITLPTNTLPCIRDDTGSMIEGIGPAGKTFLEADHYTIDLTNPFKIYIDVESSIQLYFDPEHTHIGFDESTTAVIGARSYHTRPAGTITTTEDPTDLMQAVTMFGSALKTTTAERSYPTLRGHPPTLELGERLSIPKTLESPDTGVRIAVPPDLASVFVVTPLAAYLGATLVEGEKPVITTETGFSFPLEESDDFEKTVERVLKHVFFLDCIVRTEGTTPVSLHARSVTESELSWDPATVYEQSPAERLQTYLETPYEVLEPEIPLWRLEAELKPTATSIEFLPFIANSLAIVTTENDQTNGSTAQYQHAINTFTRDSSVRGVRSSQDGADGGETETTVTGESNSEGETPESEDTASEDMGTLPPTITQFWRRQDGPDIRSTTPVSAFYNSIGREPRSDPIEIEVVCNDPEMRDELDAVNGIYGDRESLPFSVTEHYNLTRNELEEVLTHESDLFHYIGHIDESGFQCSDGIFDVSTIDSVGAKAFLLNACQSRDQGLYLVECGSIGGVVTLGDVINSGAISVGTELARLLNRGYPLYAALEIARERSLIGQQYQLVGDGLITIAQSETGIPNLAKIERSNGHFEIELELYTHRSSGKGSLYMPYLDMTGSYFISPGTIGPFTATTTQLEAFLELEEIPILYDGGLTWGNEIADKEL
ncbi:hypothetical protein OB919_06420 [Halobacteria archaeon AArc-curdl1]|uniref:CHAT domain-containing protein n=1 Tax=Natronosalvus hydrolyticus TaxID=2979988 RepID=A0AAP3E640_9EURY|nr:hypothetical protein [Halobacteria archaeon AArc-curdl1]